MEIEEVVGKHGATMILFPDDNFTHKMERVGEICRLIIDRAIPAVFQALGRADSIAANPRVVELMARAGFVSIHLGLESADNRRLARSGKGISVEECRRAIGILKSNGIHVNASFIIGWPDESLEQAKETFDFAIRSGADSVSFLYYIPPFVSGEFERFAAKGRILAREWKHVSSANPVLIPENVRLEDLERLRQETLRKFYLNHVWMKDHLRLNKEHPFLTVLGRSLWRANVVSGSLTATTVTELVEVLRGYSTTTRGSAGSPTMEIEWRGNVVTLRCCETGLEVVDGNPGMCCDRIVCTDKGLHSIFVAVDADIWVNIARKLVRLSQVSNQMPLILERLNRWQRAAAIGPRTVLTQFGFCYLYNPQVFERLASKHVVLRWAHPAGVCLAVVKCGSRQWYGSLLTHLIGYNQVVDLPSPGFDAFVAGEWDDWVRISAVAKPDPIVEDFCVLIRDILGKLPR